VTTAWPSPAPGHGFLDAAAAGALAVDRRVPRRPAADHPAAITGGAGDTGALSRERSILPRGAACATLVAHSCAHAGFEPDVVIAAADHGAARQLVESGLGITVVLESLGWCDEDATVVRRLRPAPTREVQIAVARQDWHPPATLGFRAALSRSSADRQRGSDRQRSREADDVRVAKADAAV